MNRLLKRVLVVVLLPVLVFFFAAGWVLYCAGKHRANANAIPPKRTGNAKEEQKLAEDDNVEVGLIEELMESHLTAR